MLNILMGLSILLVLGIILCIGLYIIGHITSKIAPEWYHRLNDDTIGDKVFIGFTVFVVIGAIIYLLFICYDLGKTLINTI
jgi:uncharacterized BrkB/YihY/UPF0761 family membrane protein